MKLFFAEWNEISIAFRCISLSVVVMLTLGADNGDLMEIRSLYKNMNNAARIIQWDSDNNEFQNFSRK